MQPVKQKHRKQYKQSETDEACVHATRAIATDALLLDDPTRPAGIVLGPGNARTRQSYCCAAAPRPDRIPEAAMPDRHTCSALPKVKANPWDDCYAAAKAKAHLPFSNDTPDATPNWLGDLPYRRAVSL
jgi:hypothetical protein